MGPADRTGGSPTSETNSAKLPARWLVMLPEGGKWGLSLGEVWAWLSLSLLSPVRPGAVSPWLAIWPGRTLSCLSCFVFSDPLHVYFFKIVVGDKSYFTRHKCLSIFNQNVFSDLI